MSKVIAFDVNETLLDLSALDRAFEELFGSAAARVQWFGQMLQLAFVGGLTQGYVDFTTAQYAALDMLARREGRTVSNDRARAIVDGMSDLPVHSEVPEALAQLSQTSVKIAALTNSLEQVAEAQLTNAGIRRYFDRVISADSAQALKPAPAPYLLAAETFGVPIGEVRLVAAHAWDVTGALAAGANAAFVARPGAVLSPIGPQPDIVGRDIADVVDQIIQQEAL